MTHDSIKCDIFHFGSSHGARTMDACDMTHAITRDMTQNSWLIHIWHDFFGNSHAWSAHNRRRKGSDRQSHRSPCPNSLLWYLLQCVAVCCSVLQCAAVCWSVLQGAAGCCRVLQDVAGCYSVLQCPCLSSLLYNLLQCGAVCFRVLQGVTVCCSALALFLASDRSYIICRSVLQCGAVWCSVVQCVAVCCSVLQCVAVCCSVL